MSAPRLITDEQDADGDGALLLSGAAVEVNSKGEAVERQGQQNTPGVEPVDDGAADELPAPAARDALHLFAQSPALLFIHWSHAADPSAALRDAFADAAEHYRLVVRLSDLTAATEQHIIASPERAQWLDAEPDRDYRADLGYHAEGLPFVRLLSSTVVHTPRAAVSPDADAAPEFHIADADFARLLEHIGYAPDSVARHATHARRDAATTTPSAYCHNNTSGQWEARSSKSKVQS